MSTGANASSPRATTQAATPRVESEELLSTLLGLTRSALPVDVSLTIAVGDPAEPTASLTHDGFGQAGDGVQWRAGQGPTHTAYATKVTSTSADLMTDTRWPRLQDVIQGAPLSTGSWTASKTVSRLGSVFAAGELGLDVVPAAAMSASAVPLMRGGQVMGVLTAYSGQPEAFDGADAADQLTRLAATSVVMVSWMQRLQRAQDDAANMHVALAGRAPMEQAKGIVAARLDLSLEQAFEVIARVSQDRNVRARDVAALLIAEPASRAFDDVLLTAALRLGFPPR